MRISFDYEIKDAEDITTMTKFIQNIFEKNECHITTANLYFSIKDLNNESCGLYNENGEKIKYIVKDKKYKSKQNEPIYIVMDKAKNEKLYIYEKIDNS